MTMDYQYSDSIARQLLIDPVNEKANKLCILTSQATPSMVSWLLKSYEEMGIANVVIELIISGVVNDGIDELTYNGFRDLHCARYSMTWNKFSCSYLFQPPVPQKNYYIWMNDEVPVKAFECLNELTQQSMLRQQNNFIQECSALNAYRIFQKAVGCSIYCNHSEVDDYIIVRSHSASITPSIGEENRIHLSLLARGGETGSRSGLNWGQRNNRNKNEAYIPLPIKIARTNFFPLNKQHFLVVTDDHHTLQLRVEQQNDMAITTPASNALLGEYFRNRLGLANGSYIQKKHLLEYGRTDVMFQKIDEEQYYMDFSTDKHINT